ncbi:MAG: YesL family protein [Lachnospiraceae bacterium]|nr:YesL family protein [Lachnospiraceae bacterium]
MIILSKIFDLILLNVCFVVCCIPVITIGPALTGMYAVALKMADGEWGDTFKTFKEAFLGSFKKTVIVWLICGGLGALFAADIYIIFYMLPEAYRLLQIPIWLLLFVDISVMIYAFPLMARYEERIPAVFKNSVLLSLGNIPLTVFIIVLFAVITDIALHNGGLMVLLFSIFLFIGCALLAWIFSLFFRKAFSKIENKD